MGREAMGKEMGRSAVETEVDDRALLAEARRAILSTIAPDGRPRSVPICFVVVGAAVWTPLDEKPKRTPDPRALARVRDILRDPRVTLLVDRWDEDWARLAWLRIEGTASLVEPGEDGHERAVWGLRARYPQYATQTLEDRPLIRIDMEGVVAWSAADPGQEPGRPAPSPPSADLPGG